METVIGFGAGIVAVLMIRHLGHKLENSGRLGSAGLVITAAVDVLIDGLVIGTAFAGTAQRGLLMAAAISLEFLFLGISVTIALAESRSKLSALSATAGIGALALGAALEARRCCPAPRTHRWQWYWRSEPSQ